MIQIKFSLEIIINKKKKKMSFILVFRDQVGNGYEYHYYCNKNKLNGDIFEVRPWAILQSYYKQFGKRDLLAESLKQKNLTRKKNLILPIFPYLRCLQAFQTIYQFCFSLN